MCGFAGVFSTDGALVREALVREMGACMRHRGPDDDGFLADGPVALAFRRLSILDLSPAGHQPFTSADGALTIVFNGEIFNYRELRALLVAKGHSFRSESDTEVLLCAYAEWGTECLPKLNGMWAFLIYDRRRKLLFGARDRFGVKPLYRLKVGGSHYFASEIKALHLVDDTALEINWPLAARFLEIGSLDAVSLDQQTFFKNVREVPAGHGFTISVDGQEKLWSYWTLPEREDVFEGDPTETFAELFEDAVRLRLRSDVPVGVALSGGMDSSSIIAMMARMLDSSDGKALNGLNAFSYMPKDFDEERYIRDSIALTGATLHKTDAPPVEMWETLRSVLEIHDEPLHSPTALAGFQVYQLAAQSGVRVMLGGQGADEVLGGYPPYFSEAWLELIRRGRVLEAVSEIRAFAKLHRQSPGPLMQRQLIRWAATTLPRPRRSSRRLGRYANTLTADATRFSAQFAESSQPLGLYDVLSVSLEQAPLPLYLRIEDRNSMAHSVEARLPFLDYRLVTLAFRLENRWKIRGPWNKFILRSAMTGVVPESIRTRVDKMGFPTGFSAWIRGPLKGTVESLLQSEDIDAAGLLDDKQLRALYSEHLSGGVDHGSAIFNALQFAQWHRMIKARSSGL